MTSPLTRLYRYVGPPEIAERSRELPPGVPVRDLNDLRQAMSSIAGGTREPVTCTFVVDRLGTLRLADRSSEHVACADGGPVMAAGEITVSADGEVLEVSNQSTGFCPEAESWPVMSRTLRTSGLDDPGGWTASFELRRCPGCGARTLIKEGVFECVECGGDLPDRWNFDRTVCRRAVVRLEKSHWVVDAIEEAASSDQDRVSSTVGSENMVLALADGAGGTSGGRAAAELVVEEAGRLLAGSAIDLLRDLDRRIASTAGGQTTASVARLFANGAVDGASVGDSETWVAGNEGWSELSEGQQRKPLLGSGRALPIPFAHPPAARLVMCSDGLSKYVKWNDVLALLESDDADFPWRLADAARLPSGELQDDLALLYVRRLVAAVGST